MPRRPSRFWQRTLYLLAFWGAANQAPVVAAPITFNTALPVAKGEFVARLQGVVGNSGQDPRAADRELTIRELVSVLGYGVSGRLAVFGALPYRDNELALDRGGQRIRRSASGMGDITLFGRYTVHRIDRPGRTFRVAPFAGVEAPTGEDDARDAMGRLPPGLQPGSGAWDGFVGLVATYQTLDFQLDGQLSYRKSGHANGFEGGDVARLDGSLQRRLLPRSLGGGVPRFLYGVLEGNLVHRDEDSVNGRADPDSGGTTLFLSPGLQLVSKRWIGEASVQLPVLQELNGAGLKTDYIVRGGFRFNF